MPSGARKGSRGRPMGEGAPAFVDPVRATNVVSRSAGLPPAAVRTRAVLAVAAARAVAGAVVAVVVFAVPLAVTGRAGAAWVGAMLGLVTRAGDVVGRRAGGCRARRRPRRRRAGRRRAGERHGAGGFTVQTRRRGPAAAGEH